MKTSFFITTTAVILTSMSLIGCQSGTTPAKAAAVTPVVTAPTAAPTTDSASPKSIKQIADEAMHSKGKLTKEQINALIIANAKCTPN